MSKAERTILVVDDNAENRALFQATLEDEGYGVRLATSGEEGLRSLEVEMPDCVLLDVRMPGLSGFEVCKKIRELPDGADLPVIFLTALRDVDTFDAALQAGGDDFLTKPVRPTELLVRVQTALKLREAGETVRGQYDVIKQQRDDLMRLQLQKERLSSFLVHDLKNPINSIDLRAQQALRDETLSSRSRTALLHVREEARRLNRMTLNLLDISKSDETGLVPRQEDCALDVLVEQALEELELQATMAGVSFDCRLEVSTLSGDADLLRRVIGNLIENAIRHAPEGTQVRVSSARDGETVVVRVSDEGPGVPVALRDRIFEPFAQLANQHGMVSRAGRGLGLTFCRRAVEAHGGSIGIEDADTGSIFFVKLPLTQ